MLIIAAHPDDEVLGAGATISKYSSEGNDVYVCILSSTVDARYLKPSQLLLNANTVSVNELLGVKKVYTSNFPNIAFNTVPHLELVQFIEKIILETKCTTLITHHPSDLNNDHYHTSIACQAASRIWQRGKEMPMIEKLLYFEVPSSTEWGLNKGMNGFNPNYFIEVGEEKINKKIQALSLYKDVMRDYPHPRCKETIHALAVYRGGQSGLNYAEAFEIGYINVK